MGMLAKVRISRAAGTNALAKPATDDKGNPTPATDSTGKPAGVSGQRMKPYVCEIDERPDGT